MGVGQDIENSILKESEGSGANKTLNPNSQIIEFISEINITNFEILINDENNEKFNKLMKKYKNLKEFISTESKKNPYFEDIMKESFSSKFDIEVNKDFSIMIKKLVESEIKFLEFNSNSKLVKKEINNFSSGTSSYSRFKLFIEFLKFAKEDIAKKYPDRKKFHLFIDEPETFCHPELINKIAKEIYEISQIINVSVATHSPVFLKKIIQLKKYDVNKKAKEEKEKEKFEIKYFFPFQKEVERKTKQDEKLPSTNPVNHSNTMEIKIFGDATSKLNSREWENLVESLFSTNVIFFEGLSDYEFLYDIFYNYKKEDFNEKYITFIDCGSRGGVKKMAEVLNDLNLDEYINILIFYDLDFKNLDKKFPIHFDGENYFLKKE